MYFPRGVSQGRGRRGRPRRCARAPCMQATVPHADSRSPTCSRKKTPPSASFEYVRPRYRDPLYQLRRGPVDAALSAGRRSFAIFAHGNNRHSAMHGRGTMASSSGSKSEDITKTPFSRHAQLPQEGIRTSAVALQRGASRWVCWAPRSYLWCERGCAAAMRDSDTACSRLSYGAATRASSAPKSS